MTGFGAGEAPTLKGRLVVEARSVNHRFLEVRVKLPREMVDHQVFVEQLVRQRLSRGRIDLVAHSEGAEHAPVTLAVVANLDGALAHAPHVDVAKIYHVAHGANVGEPQVRHRGIEEHLPRKRPDGNGQIDEVEHPPAAPEAHVEAGVDVNRAAVREVSLEARLVLHEGPRVEDREGAGVHGVEGLGGGAEGEARRAIRRRHIPRSLEGEPARDARDAHDRVGDGHVGDAPPCGATLGRHGAPTPRVEGALRHRAKVDHRNVRDGPLPPDGPPRHLEREAHARREHHPVVDGEGALTGRAHRAEEHRLGPAPHELSRRAHLRAAREHGADAHLHRGARRHPARVEVELHRQPLAPSVRDGRARSRPRRARSRPAARALRRA